MQWWNDFWTWVNENQLAATVIGGLVVVAVVGLFSRLPKIGPHVRKGLGHVWVGMKWLWSWRPVSYRRHRREMIQQNEAMLAEVGGIAGAASKNEAAISGANLWAQQAIEKVRLSIPDVALALQTQVSEHTHAIEDLTKEVEKLKAKPGLKIDKDANVRAAVVNPQPSMPLPRPRWNIGPENTEEPDLYVIQNMVPRSVAREVRIEADEDMQIIDAGHWEDLSVEGPTRGHGNFIGVSNERGEEHGVTLVISWYDEHGLKDSVSKSVYPKKPQEFKVWSTSEQVIAPSAAEPDPWDNLKKGDTPF